MKLDDFRASDNVEDHRDGSYSGGGGGGGFSVGRGGLGLGGIVLVLVVSYFTGISPQALIGVVETVTGNGGGVVTRNEPGPSPTGTPTDAEGQFVARVLGSTEDTWTQVFKEQVGKAYVKPRLVIYRGSDNTGRCGTAESRMGPFYCPNDQKIYLDTEFFDEMRSRFNACPATQGACAFAQAYVMAHEVGHHVQFLLGDLQKIDQLKQRASEAQANALSVMVELQADCYAGVWANKTQQRFKFIEAGDIEGALQTAQAIGDDTLQGARGRVVPDSFTHGSAAQRQRWLVNGLKTGDIKSCNTFNAPSL